MSSVIISPISATHTYPLRSAVLRTGLPIESCQFEGDEAETTYHYGAFSHAPRDGRQLIGIVSLYQVLTDPDKWAEKISWQLRAMATHPSVRGQGVGKQLVRHLLNQHQGSGDIWCNARQHAVGFYAKLGFINDGKLFEIEGVGPHQKMYYQP